MVIPVCRSGDRLGVVLAALMDKEVGTGRPEAILVEKAEWPMRSYSSMARVTPVTVTSSVPPELTLSLWRVTTLLILWRSGSV